MRWPLRNQIMLPLLAVALASLASVGAIQAWLAARQTRARIERQLQGVVGVLAESNFPLTDAVLRQMRELSGAEFVLADRHGATLATSSAQPLAPLPPDGMLSERADVSLGPPVLIGDQSYFHSAVELRERSRPAVPAVLHVLFPRDQYLRAWRQAFVPSLLVGVVAVAAAVVVASVIAGRVSRTTKRLGEEVLRMAQGDFRPLELPMRNDEIRDLSISVNRTAGMLADYQEQVRRTERMRTLALLGAGLAHEMRNAATGCRMALDLHDQHRGVGCDEESLEVARRQLRLMDGLLQRFLRSGRPTEETEKAEIDLVELVDNLLPLVGPMARHVGVDLRWARPAGAITVCADADALSQAIVNVLINAIEAAQHDAARHVAVCEVDVEVSETSTDGALLTVSDSGPGPSESLTDSLFDPFVTTKPEGVGLGLAVVKQVAQSHGGSIAWSRDDGVTRFRLELPLAAKGLCRV